MAVENVNFSTKSNYCYCIQFMITRKVVKGGILEEMEKRIPKDVCIEISSVCTNVNYNLRRCYCSRLILLKAISSTQTI